MCVRELDIPTHFSLNIVVIKTELALARAISKGASLSDSLPSGNSLCLDLLLGRRDLSFAAFYTVPSLRQALGSAVGVACSLFSLGKGVLIHSFMNLVSLLQGSAVAGAMLL